MTTSEICSVDSNELAFVKLKNKLINLKISCKTEKYVISLMNGSTDENRRESNANYVGP